MTFLLLGFLLHRNPTIIKVSVFYRFIQFMKSSVNIKSLPFAMFLLHGSDFIFYTRAEDI
ncbi:hypothetical protein H8923_13525 [Romboutsia hominis]|uniref:Uncharacterized protein n=1 Tax=Romboutsia faecis TaxID=2764597 RepID=A0ABR7JS90_9FIRM|nr:hypothetical protein [Romboutsia faecis]MBC5997779.1 hypothetical protein [Romboutsia faecis]